MTQEQIEKAKLLNQYISDEVQMWIDHSKIKDDPWYQEELEKFKQQINLRKDSC